jgi:hypothetical protein
LIKIEKPKRNTDLKDFRSEVVKFSLRDKRQQ